MNIQASWLIGIIKTGELILLSLATAPDAIVAYSDPPGRVAHLDHTQGEVSLLFPCHVTY